MLKQVVGILAGTALLGSLAFAQAGDVNAGKIVYDKKCRICHGDNGEGNPEVAKKLNAEQKPLGSDDIQKQSDADLRKTITEGKGKMKPPKNVTDADITNVIAFVRTLKK
ncbi:MAG: cytochrome c [Acidobacteriales bacterium]|nr:cytochrome c [Terriglobales bacterium]